MPAPHPPEWALAQGFPAPHKRETFCAYVERLGLDCAEIMDGLTERTLALANVRLAAKIAEDAPRQFGRYLDARKRAVLGQVSRRAI